jgi:hypothetical protein
VNLPDPVKLGLTVRIFNYDAVTLYMRVDGYASGWTFTTNDLGAWATGTNASRNLDQFGSRARPSSETTETITVRLRAYTDAGYTILKWTYERTIELVFIKSDDGTWTQDVLNNFDDGTVQGWACANEEGNAGGLPDIIVATDYVLSTPYSLRMRQQPAYTTTYPVRGRLYKSFATPNHAKVFAIIDFRQDGGAANWQKYNIISTDGTTIIYLGRAHDAVAANYTPRARWIRTVIPLPPNTTVEIRIVQHFYNASMTNYHYLWMDDFRIISK